MAKPTDLANWATDANYPADASPEASTPTKVAYTLGQEATGWRPKARPPARELNTWMHRVGTWIAWLDALFGADGTLTLDEHASVKISGNGLYKRPVRWRPIDVSAAECGKDDAAPRYWANAMPRFVTNGDSFYLPLPVEEGERITAVKVRVGGHNGGAGEFTLKVYRRDVSGSVPVQTQLGATAESVNVSGAGAPENLEVSGLEEIVSGTEYTYYAVVTDGAVTGSPSLQGAWLATDVPDAP